MKKIWLFVVGCLVLSGCSTKNVSYEKDDTWDEYVAGWDRAKTWEDVDEYADWVYAEITFEQVTDEYPIIESQVLDYSVSGVYFDDGKIREMAGEKFDVNRLVSNYAVGTGVIVTCVVLTVATSMGTAPVCCFIAGALEGSVTNAVRGAAFAAAMKGVCDAIRTHGDMEETFYEALEGSSEGYKWGAIFGAISGSLANAYCFVEDTPVWTYDGLVPICEVKEGDLAYAYDVVSDTYVYRPVLGVFRNEVDETIEVSANGETIVCTPSHPWLTAFGWKLASILDESDDVMGCDGLYYPVQEVHGITGEEETYSLCVEDCHSYIVGNTGFIVHNRCKINERYAGTTVMCSDPVLAGRYPDGVPFTPQGYPDFSGYAKESITFEPVGSSEGMCLTGNHAKDIRMANKIMGYERTPVGYTWHHSEDMRTLQLVPTDLHRGIRHSGGASLIREMLKR